jgi:GT2 family glycosyltransferase
VNRAVSVVVITRDRPVALRRCLAALEASDQEGWRIDVHVIDDGAEDVGLPAARNLAAERVSTPFVLFTDDDCVPEPSWAARLADELESGVDAVGGLTVNGNPADVVAEAAQLVANAPAKAGYANRASVFVPASNFGCRIDVLRAIPFDESYTDRGAEDRDWFERVGHAGYRVRYVCEAVVRHFPELSVASFLAKSARYGRGTYRFRAQHRDGRLETARFYLDLMRRSVREGPLTGLLVGASQIATATGYVAEALLSEGERRRST